MLQIHNGTCVARTLTHYRNNGNVIIGVFLSCDFIHFLPYILFSVPMTCLQCLPISLTVNALCRYQTWHWLHYVRIKKKLGYIVGVQDLFFFMDTENHRYRQVNYIAKLHLIGKTHDFSSYMIFIMYLLIRFSHVLM